MAKYGDSVVEVGNWVVAGRGEGRDFGQVLAADSSEIEIGWDSGVRTKIDLRTYCVDDDTIEVYSTEAEALAAFRR